MRLPPHEALQLRETERTIGFRYQAILRDLDRAESDISFHVEELSSQSSEADASAGP